MRKLYDDFLVPLGHTVILAGLTLYIWCVWLFWWRWKYGPEHGPPRTVMMWTLTADFDQNGGDARDCAKTK